LERILIVRQQNNQLGDLLCSLPLYYALKKKFPDSYISLIAGKTNYTIPYKELCPYVDNIVQMDRETFIKNVSFIREVRSLKCNIGIIPSTMQFSRTSHVINFLSGAGVRIGVKQFDNIKNKSSWLLNTKGIFEWGKHKVHQSDRILDIAKLIGCDLTDDEKQIKVTYSNDVLLNAKEFIKTKFPAKESKIFGMHPGAGKEANRWDYNKFISLAKSLKEKYNCSFLITSGYIDKEITDKTIQGFKENNIPYVLLENAEIRLLGAILSMIDLYVSNDTGVMHLAGFSGGKVVSLFGPTNGYEWAPQQIGCTYIQSESGNINDISVEKVMDTIYNLVN
jgi:ADP-heptose:LPS heptosyltransferase